MTVKKEKLHDITQIFGDDGLLNVLGGMVGLTHALGQNAAGHLAIYNGKAAVTPNADGSEHVSINFDRK